MAGENVGVVDNRYVGRHRTDPAVGCPECSAPSRRVGDDHYECTGTSAHRFAVSGCETCGHLRVATQPGDVWECTRPDLHHARPR